MSIDPSDPHAADSREEAGASTVDRRAFVKLVAALAAAGAFVGESSAASAEDAAEITTDVIAQAERLAGLTFTEDERKMMLGMAKVRLKSYEELRALKIPNSIPPAVYFRPDPPGFVPVPPSKGEGAHESGGKESAMALPPWEGERPADPSDLAFLDAYQISSLIKRGKLSPVEITEIYLDRLKTTGTKLNCVVTLLEESAKKEAATAESELKRGHDRGPLHGVPWGAKDLFAARGAPTTWGAKPYKNQIFDEDATVVAKLREAGAILVAKLSMGELAQGDVWMKGKTLNPWNLAKGSSGSSAGPGAATAAGLVGFSLGTETLGSIVSPSATCGVTGLRPTFGRVSRHGAMALSWSMDKIGPMCRSVEDCALVFNAIHGADGRDPTAVTRPFAWPRAADFSKLRFGYEKESFELGASEEKAVNKAALDQLASMGAKLVPIKLPDFPLSAMRLVLNAEAAAAFDELTLSNRDDLLRLQTPMGWPNTFRAIRLMPAVEYIQAQRARTMLMREMAKVMADFDVYLSPGAMLSRSLTLTNLTGHPTVVVPSGFVDGMPRAICFIGNLYDDARLLGIARAYQNETPWHKKHPIIA